MDIYASYAFMGGFIKLFALFFLPMIAFAFYRRMIFDHD